MLFGPLHVHECVSASVCVMSLITLVGAWEFVECRVTSMVTFPKLLVPGQQLRTRDLNEEEDSQLREEWRTAEAGELAIMLMSLWLNVSIAVCSQN